MVTTSKVAGSEGKKREFRAVYLLTNFALILGLVIDLLKKDIYNNYLPIDISTLALWIVSFFLMLFRIGNLSISFGIVAYVLLVNITSSYLVYHLDKDSLTQFYRDSVFIMGVITLVSYLINKYHALIMGGLYIIFVIFISTYYSEEILDNSYTLIFAFLAYSTILFYFVKRHEDTDRELKMTTERLFHQNEELIQKQEEILAQRDILSRQKKLIESRNNAILDGIYFAKSIQESVLSLESDISDNFRQYMIINKPKSVISGDFFWVKIWKDKLYVAVADCTGHGVPGALVSMLANMYLGRAFIEIEDPNPGKILNYINDAINKELNLVTNFHSRIGMDIAIISLNEERSVLQYAGAFSPMYLIRRDNIRIFEPTKMTIGSTIIPDLPFDFINSEVDLLKGDRVYLFTDGAVDQFGEKLDKKFGYARFRNALVDTNHGSMETQKELLYAKWKNWKGDRSQVDDVLILGLEI